MAYLIGLLTDKEQTELISRGWEFEKPPFELTPRPDELPPDMEFKMVFVDTNLFDIMNGPDWEK